MNQPIFCLFIALLVLAGGGTLSVSACPSCADAVPLESGADAEEALQLASGYNRSIYLMVAMPYLALAVVGLLVYRQCRTYQAQGNGTSLNENDNSRLTIPEGAE
jgi:hypothetical protein